MPLVEQVLLTLSEHLSSPPVFCSCYSIFSFMCMFCRLLFVLLSKILSFSFGHCVVCSSSIYGFWLPLWYLQTLLCVYLFLKIDFRVKTFWWEIIRSTWTNILLNMNWAIFQIYSWWEQVYKQLLSKFTNSYSPRLQTVTLQVYKQLLFKFKG